MILTADELRLLTKKQRVSAQALDSFHLFPVGV